jgi:hypothetical protein
MLLCDCFGLNVAILSGIILSSAMLSANRQNCICFRMIMLSLIMQSAIMLGLVTQNVVMWMVIKYYAEWRCTECLYAECHGTYSFLTIIGGLKVNQNKFKFVQNVAQLQEMLD